MVVQIKDKFTERNESNKKEKQNMLKACDALFNTDLKLDIYFPFLLTSPILYRQDRTPTNHTYSYLYFT